MISRTHFQSKQDREEVFSNSFGNPSFHCLYADAASLIGNSFPWHWHTAFEVDYVAGCDVQFDFAGTSLQIPQGNAVFINSGEIHSYRLIEPKQCRIYAFLFEPVLLAGTYNDPIFQKYIIPVRNAGFSALQISPKTESGQAMLASVKQIIQLSEDESAYYELALRAELGTFWCGLMDSLKVMDEYSRPKNRDCDRIKQMLDYIHLNYDHQIFLKDIAASAMIGPRECSRCFQRSIGRSPMDCLNDYRVQMAIQQLITTDKNITEISEDCGFSSSSYFGKVFKQHTGLSPLQYCSTVK